MSHREPNFAKWAPGGSQRNCPVAVPLWFSDTAKPTGAVVIVLPNVVVVLATESTFPLGGGNL